MESSDVCDFVCLDFIPYRLYLEGFGQLITKICKFIKVGVVYVNVVGIGIQDMPITDTLERTGTRRPIVPKKTDIRVGQYAAKNSISKKSAYEEIVDFVIDEQGDIKEENVNT